FCGSTFGTIPNDPESFKFITVRLCDVAVVDMNDRFCGNHSFHLPQISGSRCGRSDLFKMPGQTIHNIDLSGRFMELVNDVGEQAASGKFYLRKLKFFFSTGRYLM
ncbi:MAG: hypothetical protein Q4C82_04750, partial [Eubacteriales bacterium]|nr:hypothetical protein [Eubacteriales bacterium]